MIQKEKKKNKKEGSKSITQEQQDTDWYQNTPATNDNKHKHSTFHHLIRFNQTFYSSDIFLKTCEKEGLQHHLLGVLNSVLLRKI